MCFMMLVFIFYFLFRFINLNLIRFSFFSFLFLPTLLTSQLRGGLPNKRRRERSMRRGRRGRLGTRRKMKEICMTKYLFSQDIWNFAVSPLSKIWQTAKNINVEHIVWFLETVLGHQGHIRELCTQRFLERLDRSRYLN